MKIYSQLLEFQKKLRKVNKDAKGYGYNYASFDNVVETIKPELEKQGLGYTHTFEGQDIVCTLFNTEGDTLVSRLTLPQESLKGMNASQSMGAAITYARRYTLTAILGLVTDDDTDGVVNTPKTNKVAPKRQNIDDNKAWLNLGTPEFEKIVELASKHPAEKLINFARTKFKVSTEVSEAINNLYK